ncbi:hypothetical protein BpHYR1_004802 [Brachionus plicatilis]|uniref:Uncharacterized protein n=1 Tax=Brachionus plicatilis TaxID=10195 RepID=A0A3M7PWD5_BRAPC|nr:hypothetical protein BpHYR1_004802 [Brachionus plicatilis]
MLEIFFSIFDIKTARSKLSKKSNRPLNSPDLYPCDYFFWNEIVSNMRPNKVGRAESKKTFENLFDNKRKTTKNLNNELIKLVTINSSFKEAWKKAANSIKMAKCAKK